jgi:transposase
MRPQRYVVRLTDEERAQCRELIRAGTARARSVMHAQVLLKADTRPGGPGWKDGAISAALDVSTVTVGTIRKRMATEGLDAALSHYRPPRREYHSKLDGRQEAHLLALAKTPPPEGHARWSLRLLADRMVQLDYVDTLSYNTVGRLLKKKNCSPGAACAGASRRKRTPIS